MQQPESNTGMVSGVSLEAPANDRTGFGTELNKKLKEGGML
jgi:hypothetical protein